MRLAGAVDGYASPSEISGWAKIVGGDTQTPLCINAVYNGSVIDSTCANQSRGGEDFCGFRMLLKNPIPADVILAGNLTVFAVSESGDTIALPFWSKLLDRLRLVQVEQYVAALNNDDARQILRALISRNKSPWALRLRNAVPFIDNGMVPPVAMANLHEKSDIALSVGTTSPNGNVVVGRQGHLFILKGGNDLIAQYNTDPSSLIVKDTASAWLSIIGKRVQTAEQIGIKFAQIIIPEKSSLLPEYFPLKLSGPTPIFNAIERGILADRELSSHYVDARHNLTTAASASIRDAGFRKIDSHFNAEGASAIFAALLRQFDIPDPFQANMAVALLAGGDLAAHFLATPFVEQVYRPPPDMSSAFESTLRRIQVRGAGHGSYVGTILKWRNDTAPVPLRVLVFGNSFFSIGENADSLSWWFARCFREFHFVWSPDLDLSYIEEIQPDLLICQTIERFLTTPPKL